jgi:sodium/proline symporter
LTRSRVVVIVLGTGAIAAALYGSQEIFSRVLFAWAAMGAAFGPLILVTIWRGPVSVPATVTAMALGFTLSIGAYYLPPHAWKGTLERVVPVVIALAAALLLWRRKNGIDATP